MIATRTTEPVIEPVTLAEVKEHLRVTANDDDSILIGLIQACREYAEMFTNRALVEQTWKVYLQGWPSCDEFELPYAPLQSVTSIKYTETDDTENTWDSDEYEVDTDSEPGRIVLAYGYSWPSEALHPKNPIEIEYVAGYAGDSNSPEDFTVNIPENIKNAIKLDVELRYDRASESYIKKLAEVRDMILSPYRVWSF